jgi:hypothetical protein
MGQISTILAALFCATAPLGSIEVPKPQTESSQSSFKLGRELVSSVRASYENGKYNEFFSEMDESYKKADLTGVVQMRQKQIPVGFQEEWEQKFIQLQQMKNSELLNTLSDKDNSIFAQKVRSAAANITTPEQDKAISRLNSFIAMAPNTGANEDENILIDLDVEYEYKLLHAKLPVSDVSSEKMNEHQLALRMEKMDKMVEASKNFQDLSLKQAVGLAKASLDARMARNLDGADLNALVKGKVKPSNEAEENAYTVISSYQGQFSDLMKQLDNANR